MFVHVRKAVERLRTAASEGLINGGQVIAIHSELDKVDKEGVAPEVKSIVDKVRGLVPPSWNPALHDGFDQIVLNCKAALEYIDGYKGGERKDP